MDKYRCEGEYIKKLDNVKDHSLEKYLQRSKYQNIVYRSIQFFFLEIHNKELI